MSPCLEIIIDLKTQGLQEWCNINKDHRCKSPKGFKDQKQTEKIKLTDDHNASKDQRETLGKIWSATASENVSLDL